MSEIAYLIAYFQISKYLINTVLKQQNAEASVCHLMLL